MFIKMDCNNIAGDASNVVTGIEDTILVNSQTNTVDVGFAPSQVILQKMIDQTTSGHESYIFLAWADNQGNYKSYDLANGGNINRIVITPTSTGFTWTFTATSSSAWEGGYTWYAVK